MTLRESYEYALVECNKLKAPSILLEDYIYLFYKAIQQYINTVYNRCEYDQQSSDDLRWLQAQHVIENTETDTTKIPEHSGSPMGKVWKVELPKDYMHLLNCIATFTEGKRCGEGSLETSASCRRLTSDLYSGLMNNYYLKPTSKRPYYYIINDNSDFVDTDTSKTPSEEDWWMKDNGSRESNQSSVKMEIHVGKSNSALKRVYITYLKSPKYYAMSQEDLYSLADTTPVLEFPDYVCYEIINIYTRLLLENAGDPRLQTHIPINQTILSGQQIK